MPLTLGRKASALCYARNGALFLLAVSERQWLMFPTERAAHREW